MKKTLMIPNQQLVSWRNPTDYAEAMPELIYEATGDYFNVLFSRRRHPLLIRLLDQFCTGWNIKSNEQLGILDIGWLHAGRGHGCSAKKVKE
jgi:hypothetical protein